MGFDVITMGRIGVDVYPQQVGVSLREVSSFGKFLGGSSTNVAVASARYGRRGPSREEARRWVREALQHVTVAAGNLDEWDTAVGSRDPRVAADTPGLDLAVVKQGPKGVLARRGYEWAEVPPVPVEVVNGLGAGDAFGGALCHGLLAGWDLERTMRFCNAAGALVASRLACADAMPTEDEVEEILAAGRA